MRESCIAEHFQHYASLDPQEIQFLESLEHKTLSYPRNSLLWHEGSEASNFYIVRHGWAYSSRILNNGSRQVLDVFLPGDLIGLGDYAYKHRLNNAHALLDIELCTFSRNRIQGIFGRTGPLGQLLFSFAAQGQALLRERITTLGRRSARQRVAHLLVELSVRLENSPVLVENSDRLPLSQTLMADLLGLSAVHINRTVRGLREDGLIELQHQAIKLRDISALKAVAGFNPKYLDEAFTGLFPEHRRADDLLQEDSRRDPHAEASPPPLSSSA